MSDDVAGFMARWTEEQRIRVTRHSQVISVALNGSLEVGYALQPGTVFVAWSLDRRRIDEIVGAINADSIQASDFDSDFRDLDFSRAAPDIFDVTPAFLCIRYRGRPLVDPAITPPSHTAISYAVLPWVGAPLDVAEFNATAWVAAGDETPIVLVITNPPAVDEDELRLINALPSSVAELGVEPRFTPTAAAFVGAAAGAAAVGHYVDKALNGIDKAAANAYKDHVKNQARDQRVAEERYRLKQQADRNRWRNASFLPAGRAAPSAQSDFPVGATLDELLIRRVRSLRARPSQEDDE